jgi:hypothetical protein
MSNHDKDKLFILCLIALSSIIEVEYIAGGYIIGYYLIPWVMNKIGE